MIEVKILKNVENNWFKQNRIKSNFIHYLFFFILFVILVTASNIVLRDKIISNYNLNKYITEKINKSSKETNEGLKKKNISFKNCYISVDNSNIKVIHLIITRFLIELPVKIEFHKIIQKKEYILNGIRVMKKYLLPSLENQSCTDFIWILLIGNKANLTYVKSLINFNHSLDLRLISEKDIKKYIKNITKGFDVLITTRIDYDDRIYYDAVNDVRKAVNINKPIILYGYNRGYYYFESEDKYFNNYSNTTDGAWGLFLSLIIVLNKVNDIYTIYDMGNHVVIRKNLTKYYKYYGINKLDYEPISFLTSLSHKFHELP